MPILVVENMPGDLFHRLQQRAQVGHRTLGDEVVRILQHDLDRAEALESSPRLPDPPILTEEGPPPYDFPRPSDAVVVTAIPGEPRLPDPPGLATHSEVSYV